MRSCAVRAYCAPVYVWDVLCAILLRNASIEFDTAKVAPSGFTSSGMLLYGPFLSLVQMYRVLLRCVLHHGVLLRVCRACSTSVRYAPVRCAHARCFLPTLVSAQLATVDAVLIDSIRSELPTVAGGRLMPPN